MAFKMGRQCQSAFFAKMRLPRGSYSVAHSRTTSCRADQGTEICAKMKSYIYAMHLQLIQKRTKYGPKPVVF
jgi:hypothetical protein